MPPTALQRGVLSKDRPRSRDLTFATYGLATHELCDEVERGAAFASAWLWHDYAEDLWSDMGSLGKVHLNVVASLPEENVLMGPPTKQVLERSLRVAISHGRTVTCINAHPAVEAAREAKTRHEERNRILSQRYANHLRAAQLASYLDRLEKAAETDEVLDLAVLRQVRNTWRELHQVFGSALRVPLASPASDGSFVLTWRHGMDYLEAEFEVDGAWSFFYQDDRVPRDAADWEERALWYAEAGPGGALPSQSWDKLRLFVITR